METPNGERGLGVDVPIPPTPLEGQEAIEERMVEVGVEDGRGLELIGQELVIHSATQPTYPTNLEGLQVQSAAAVTALVTPVRPSRISPSASTMAVEVMDGAGLGGSHQRFPTGPPVSYGPVVGSQGGQDTTPLFTQDQLRRLHDLQQQAPYLYQKRSGKGIGDGEK